jgi:ribosomal protein S27AE
MVLKNVMCPDCGQQVSFTIESGEEITDIKITTIGSKDYREECPECGSYVNLIVD